MRTHGWGGSPPVDDVEARHRILATTRDLLARGTTVTTSVVAEGLGVTRQTVYRYFATTDDLVDAAALDAVAELGDDLVAHVRDHVTTVGGDAGDAAVEIVAFVHENLRDDPALNRLVAPGRIDRTIEGLTTPEAIAVGREWLAGLPVDWEAAVGDAQGQLVEHLLRTLQTLVLDPGARSGAELRAYLQRWLAPALRVTSGPPRQAG